MNKRTAHTALRSAKARVLDARTWLIFVLTVTATTLGWANVGPGSIVAGEVRLESASLVTMVAESVTVYLDGFIAQVNCDFTMRNDGPPGRVAMVFPIGKERPLIEEDTVDTDYEFALRIDGKRVRPKHFRRDRPAGQDPLRVYDHVDWYGWDVAMPHGIVMSIHVDYEVENNNTMYTYNPYESFSYIVQTGAPWNGKIGKAIFRVVPRNVGIWQIDHIEPEGIIDEHGNIAWTYTELEPSAANDIHLDYEVTTFAPKYGDFGIFSFESVYVNELSPWLRQALRGNLAVAERSLRAEVADYGDPPSAILEVVGRQANTLLSIGRFAEMKGKWQKAIAFYQWLQYTLGGFDAVHRRYDILDLRLADCYRAVGDTVKAIDLYQRVKHSLVSHPLDCEWTLQYYYQGEWETDGPHGPLTAEDIEECHRYGGLQGLIGYCDACVRRLTN